MSDEMVSGAVAKPEKTRSCCDIATDVVQVREVLQPSPDGPPIGSAPRRSLAPECFQFGNRKRYLHLGHPQFALPGPDTVRVAWPPLWPASCSPPWWNVSFARASKLDNAGKTGRVDVPRRRLAARTFARARCFGRQAREAPTGARRGCATFLSARPYAAERAPSVPVAQPISTTPRPPVGALRRWTSSRHSFSSSSPTKTVRR